MGQLSQFAHQEPLDSSAYSTSWTSTAACREGWNAPVAIDAQLRHEQFLAQLSLRLSQCVTNLLGMAPSTTTVPDDTSGSMAILHQVFLDELMAHLQSRSGAIARPLPSVHGAAPITHAWIVRHLVPVGQVWQPTQFGHVLCMTAPLQVGHTISLVLLQSLQRNYPGYVLPITGLQDPVGWLLIEPGLPSEVAAEVRLIRRSLDYLTVALRQVQTVQAQQQNYQLLLNRTQELIKTNHQKSAFLASSSHEIRAPLTAILGFTKLLQQQGLDPHIPRHHDYLSIILNSGQHLLALINDILDLSKIEANQMTLAWGTVDVQEVCQSAIDLVQEKAQDKGLAVRLALDPAIGTVLADPQRLQQMLFNLLSNAVKFTLCGSVGIQGKLGQGFLQLTVWDTGIGIAPEQQGHLFKPYSQIPSPLVSRTEGTGLGLALTQKLAALHGGHVEVISELNSGSRFTLCLPLTPIEASDSPSNPATPLPQCSLDLTALPLQPTPRMTPSSPQPRPSQQAEPPLRPRSILLVEDNLYNARLMLTYLSKLGYEVTWAKDAAEMWQALERSVPSLILMDIHLPGTDGLELTRQIRSMQPYQAIPVIAQTAMAMNGDRDLCLQAGANDYICKPIDLDALAKMICPYVGPATRPGRYSGS